MKKFVFISLVLVLAASVAFAQDGGWSVGGSGEINTLWNFRNRNPEGTHVQPTVGAAGYNMYGYYGNVPTGTFSATYSTGNGLSAGIAFDLTDDIRANVSYSTDTAAFQAEQAVKDLFTKNYAETSRLWGYYKLLDGKIHLEAAVNSRDTNYWISNEAVGNVFDSAIITATGGITSRGGGGWGFTSVDHHTYLVVDFAPIDGLNVGLFLPRIYSTSITADNASTGSPITGPGTYGTINGAGSPPGYHDVMDSDGGAYDLLKNVFNNMVFGAKYATGPVEVALQFGLKGEADKYDALNSGLYLGGFFNIADGIKAGLAMEAIFDGRSNDVLTKKNGEDKSTFGVALSFNYGAGALNAGLEGGLFFANNFKKDYKDGKDKGTFGLRPQIAYNIVENYLCLSLDVFTFFHLDSDVSKAWGIGYEITPELWFNVAGTGAGKGYYYPNGTAIIVRYKVGGYTKDGLEENAQDPYVNAFDITFKWSF
jgi:hypothetical protein